MNRPTVGESCAFGSMLSPRHFFAFPQARRQELLHAWQERSSLRSLTRTWSLAQPCPVGSKKQLSFLTYNPARFGYRGPHFHHAGTGRTVVVWMVVLFEQVCRDPASI
ncbi:MAG: hypothetical protein ACJ8AG_03625 [Ktedonobacteraceae bacterium]